MSEYYAVERTGDSLAHYGVRGMKWGVRRALAKDSYKRTDKALGREYKKAQKHLDELKRNADVQRQEAKAKIHGQRAIRSGAGTAAMLGFHGLVSSKNVRKVLKFNRDPYFNNALEETIAKGGSGLLSGLGLAQTAYHTGKAIAAKHRTTDKGHAKAVAKMNSWKNAMDDVFAGTKYSKKKYKQKRR